MRNITIIIKKCYFSFNYQMVILFSINHLVSILYAKVHLQCNQILTIFKLYQY